MKNLEHVTILEGVDVGKHYKSTHVVKVTILFFKVFLCCHLLHFVIIMANDIKISNKVEKDVGVVSI